MWPDNSLESIVRYDWLIWYRVGWFDETKTGGAFERLIGKGTHID